ncbi:MAG: ABC transporter permease [Gemmatimonadaceae bacterium]
MSRRAGFSERAYRALLAAHPRDVRARYGEAMAEHFDDLCADARSGSGRRGLAALWLRALADLASSATRNHIDAAAARVARPAAAPHTSSGGSVLRTLAYDLRFSLRVLRKSPVLTATAVLVIALGTGAVSTIFSVADAVVLRPLPGVERSAEVVNVTRSQDVGGALSASYAYYRELASRTRTLRGLAAWGMQPLTISTGGQGISSLGNVVSAGYFEVLGVRPALGRFFLPEEVGERPGEPVAVVSHGFWTRELGADSAAIGRSLLLNGRRYTVVGVAPPRFSGVYPMLKTDVWVPLAHQPLIKPGSPRLDNRNAAWLVLVGRLAAGADRAAAQRELAGLSRQYAAGAGEPEGMARYGSAKVSRATGLPSEVTTPVLAFFGVLLAVSALVLVIASVNVAGMLLARSIARRREIAVRLALGASRARLVGQLLTENLVLFALGGLAGVALAVFGTALLARIDLPVDVPLQIEARPDARAFALTMAVALVVGLAVGLAPALRASRPDLARGLRDGSAASGRRRSRLRDALLVAQVAFSLVLLAVSGLFVRALDRGRGVHPGFEVDGVATAAFDVGASGYDSARGRAFYQTLARRLSARPGVTAVGYARVLPLSMNEMGAEVAVDGYAPPGGTPGGGHFVAMNEVDAGYFDAVRHPVLAGRVFRAADDSAAAPVAVVSEAFARRYWPALPPREAVGRTFRSEGQAVTIVGVARDAKFGRLDEAPKPFVYFPAAQHWSPTSNLLVHTSGDPAALARAIRDEVRALDATLPAPTVTTLRQAASVVLLPQRVAVAVTGALGVVGLLLAVVGLYGVLSFSAAQRVREIGVRLALGATRGNVQGLVVGEGMRLAAVGMGIGLALALVATRALTPFLFGVSPLDPATFLAIAATLGSAAFVASWLPARRAAKVDPVVSLRQE